MPENVDNGFSILKNYGEDLTAKIILLILP